MAKRLSPPRDPVQLIADGLAITAERGEPLLHALLAASRVPRVRSPKLRRPRGPWCLRGACDGCLARVDGVPNVMTCMVPVRGGEKVESQAASGPSEAGVQAVTEWLFPEGFDHHRLLASFPGGARALGIVARRLAGAGSLPDHDAAPSPVRSERTQILVIGGGLAGRCAASSLASAGLHTVLVDDGPLEGGCLTALGAAHRDRLLERFPLQNTVVHPLSTAAAIYAEQVLVVTAGETIVYRPSAVIIAAGAHDTGPLLPGNDLPGVMPARALGRLAACGICPDEPIVVAGDGLFCDGVERLLHGAASIHRVPLRTVAGFEGRSRLSAVLLHDGRRLEAGAAALETPRAPAHELALQAGATVDKGRCGYVPRAGPDGRIALHTWCTGECAGLPFDPDRIIEHARAAAASAGDHVSSGRHDREPRQGP